MKRQAKRSYDQFCPFARTLDILGERWTLLIVRNFIAGPQRYKDLLDNLPGIGTNLLAARLKELQAAGIIQRRKLPPPAGSAVYEFTELGRGLEEPLLALARWGLWTLSQPGDGEFMPPAMLGAGLKIVFRPEKAGGVHEIYECRIGEDVFHVRVDDGSMEVAHGQATRPDLILTSDHETWRAMGSGGLSGPEAISTGRLRLEGDPAAGVRFARIFRPPAAKDRGTISA